MRWVTHLCAPTFLFLAGFVLALSVARRRARGKPERTIDGDMFKRGIFIMLLDPLWMRFGFGEGIVLKVLYAIGASFCLMIPLRRLKRRSLLAIALGLIFFGEGLALWTGVEHKPGLIGTFLLINGPVSQSVYVLYPLLPWLAYMILGWACGGYAL
ncbi:MAG: heparan-alpha-glucosaminide N-acetyltransferase domain-containing protein, partial [Desulfobacterales bacterium]